MVADPFNQDIESWTAYTESLSSSAYFEANEVKDASKQQQTNQYSVQCYWTLNVCIKADSGIY